MLFKLTNAIQHHILLLNKKNKVNIDKNKYGYVCMHTRHSVVILLLTLVLQRGQDSDVFAHHHFILYTSVTLDSGSTSESGYIYSG